MDGSGSVCRRVRGRACRCLVGAADGNKACGLLTPAELQIVLGTTVSLSGSGGMAAGEPTSAPVKPRPQR